MAETDFTKTCANCTYLQQQQNTHLGVCRRYPIYQSRHINEWCGEFSPLMLELPVISLPMLDIEENEKPKRKMSRRVQP